jgi:hypothetical protein
LIPRVGDAVAEELLLVVEIGPRIVEALLEDDVATDEDVLLELVDDVDGTLDVDDVDEDLDVLEVLELLERTEVELEELICEDVDDFDELALDETVVEVEDFEELPVDETDVELTEDLLVLVELVVVTDELVGLVVWTDELVELEATDELELVEVEVVEVVVVVQGGNETVLLKSYTSSLFGPPQNSEWLPLQSILQPDTPSGARVAPFWMVLAHPDSLIPKNEKL